jgi:hypothetical protein
LIFLRFEHFWFLNFFIFEHFLNLNMFKDLNWKRKKEERNNTFCWAQFLERPRWRHFRRSERSLPLKAESRCSRESGASASQFQIHGLIGRTSAIYTLKGWAKTEGEHWEKWACSYILARTMLQYAIWRWWDLS